MSEILPESKRRPDFRAPFAVVALVLLVLGVYWAVFNAEFLNFDDNEYVTENAIVCEGLTWHGAQWAFMTGHFASWLPLTWLSHMTDVQCFGLNAGAHHGVNLTLHTLNVLLLLGLLYRLTDRFWPSWVVAAWFGLHPLHVESVAWVAERKDVLSTFFALLAVWAYMRYARCRSWPAYVAAVVLFAFGLMSKPMIVTLPCLLLLLDYWPLSRLRDTDGRMTWRALPRCLIEKLPFFVLTAAVSTITYIVQAGSGAMAPMDRYSAPVRLANATAAYATYLLKTAWPTKLAILYPHPDNTLHWHALALCLVLLGAITALALWQHRRRPFLIVGWLWYLGMLVPVIGLVQVGEQAFADRYTYLPLVGVFIMVVWGVDSIAGARARRAAFAVAVAATLFWAAITQVQVRYWHDSISLFEHALAVTEDNYVAHTSLGSALLRKGDLERALPHFDAAYTLNPHYPEVLNNLGYVFLSQGNYAQALQFLQEAVERLPTYVEAHTNMGIALAGLGRYDEAIENLRKALELRPDGTAARFNLAMAYYAQGNAAAAAGEFGAVVRLSPDDTQARYRWGAALAQSGRPAAAARVLEELLVRTPDHAEAQALLDQLRKAKQVP